MTRTNRTKRMAREMQQAEGIPYTLALHRAQDAVRAEHAEDNPALDFTVHGNRDGSVDMDCTVGRCTWDAKDVGGKSLSQLMELAEAHISEAHE